MIEVAVLSIPLVGLLERFLVGGSFDVQVLFVRFGLAVEVLLLGFLPVGRNKRSLIAA